MIMNYGLWIMDYGFYNTRDEGPFDKLRTGSTTGDEDFEIRSPVSQ